MLARSPTNTILWKIYHEKTRLRPEMVKEREIIGNGERKRNYRERELPNRNEPEGL